jgi:predicted Zn-dependent peptidase
MALSATFTWNCSFCTKVAFEEYNLDNGHVILQNDPSAPVVITSVMYHVGSKMKIQKNWICSFFEHLLFEGTEKISSVENGLKL